MSLFSCKKNKTNGSRTTPNNFLIQSTGLTYSTDNAYVIFDDGSILTNGFMFVIADAKLREDNVNGISVETSMVNAMAVHVREYSPPTVNNEQSVNIGVGTFQTHTESSAIINVANYQDTYTYGGKQYGDIDGGTEFTQDGTGNRSLVINNFSINYTTRVGTIDCDYIINTANGDKITGHYDGNFDILNGF